jgi:hypothetical protein
MKSLTSLLGGRGNTKGMNYTVILKLRRRYSSKHYMKIQLTKIQLKALHGTRPVVGNGLLKAKCWQLLGIRGASISILEEKKAMTYLNKCTILLGTKGECLSQRH